MIALGYVSFCLILLKIILCQRKDAFSLYDIEGDPTEDIDLSGNAMMVSKYLTAFEDRKTYWQDLTVDTSTASQDGKNMAFTQCGRVCSWVQDSTTTSRKISRLYQNKYAPNIVYILIDDWGVNDFGKISSYMNWTTPTIDRLASNGIHLNNYYTNAVCAPSRASLLTGRYVLRLGVYTSTAELPLTEVTLAEELRSAGYRNYIVGKWHLGYSSLNQMPLQRGFDYFYGFVNGESHYWSKKFYDYVDLFENNDFVTNEDELDESLHSAYLFQSKVENVIKVHAKKYKNTPMFLYYSMQLVHYPWTAPSEYIQRCITDIDEYYHPNDDDDTDTDTNRLINYCAMNVMMDEAIANLTCVLDQNKMGDNTVLIIAGDNGGESHISGSSYPYRGHKASVMRGGISNNAIIHSQLIPLSSRGTTYSHMVHITDWLPTLMYLATNGKWKKGYTGATIDGVNIWESVIQNKPTSRSEMVFTSFQGSFAMQIGSMKYLYRVTSAAVDPPAIIFSNDKNSSLTRQLCMNPSLIMTNKSQINDINHRYGIQTSFSLINYGIVIVLIAIISWLTASIIRCMIENHRRPSSSKNRLFIDKKDMNISEIVPLL